MYQIGVTRKHFFMGLLIIAFVLGIILFAPFLTTIVISAAVSVLFYPIYVWLKKRVAGDRSWLAALITIVAFIIIVCVPVFLLGVTAINQAQDIYTWINTHGGLEAQLGKVDKMLSRFFPQEFVHFQDYATNITDQFASHLGILFSSTVSTIVSFFLVVLTTFYFLKDGARWRQTIVELSPLTDENDHKIIEKLRSAVNAIFKGYLFIGFIQGALMTIGLWIFGVPNPALWGIITCITSLVPTLGTALVAIPAILFLLATGHTLSAVGLGAWCTVVVGAVDNLLNPIIVGRKIDIHPLLVLFSVLGGLIFIGPSGILIGPLVVSFIYALMSVYRTEML
jgi:predicted PurR-regulated permease PerM